MQVNRKAPVIQNRLWIISYFRLGKLLHLMLLLEIILICFLYYYFDLAAWATKGNLLMNDAVLCCLFFPPVYPILDARSRYQNYKQIKDKLYEFGFQERLVRPFSSSRCQRDAVMAAAEELGFEQECKAFFYRSGYRYYHVFPDFIFSNPSYLCSLNFWTTTFLVKHYTSKFDFATLAVQGKIPV